MEIPKFFQTDLLSQCLSILEIFFLCLDTKKTE